MDLFVCKFTHRAVLAGQGISLAVIVTVSSQQSNTLLFSYSNPTINSLGPANAGTSAALLPAFFM